MDKSNNCEALEFLGYTTILSIFLAKGLTPAEQDLLSNFFFLIAQNLASAAVFSNDKQIICAPDDTSKDTSNITKKSNVSSNTTYSNLNELFF